MVCFYCTCLPKQLYDVIESVSESRSMAADSKQLNLCSQSRPGIFQSIKTVQIALFGNLKLRFDFMKNPQGQRADSQGGVFFLLVCTRHLVIDPDLREYSNINRNKQREFLSWKRMFTQSGWRI